MRLDRANTFFCIFFHSPPSPPPPPPPHPRADLCASAQGYLGSASLGKQRRGLVSSKAVGSRQTAEMITSSIIIFCLMRDLFLSIWRAQTLSKSQEISDGTRSREEEREAHDAEGTATGIRTDFNSPQCVTSAVRDNTA